jgi:hypothetical protein
MEFEILLLLLLLQAEGLSGADLAAAEYDFLLSDVAEVQGYDVAAVSEGFERLQFQLAPLAVLRDLLSWRLPVRVMTKPKVWVLQREAGLGAVEVL